jgi:Arc/MetJ family transcription regulator
MRTPQETDHSAAYEALMRDLLRRAAARIAKQHGAAGATPVASAEEVRDAAAQPSS